MFKITQLVFFPELPGPFSLNLSRERSKALLNVGEATQMSCSLNISEGSCSPKHKVWLCCYNCPVFSCPRAQAPTVHCATFSVALLLTSAKQGTGERERGMRWRSLNTCKGDDGTLNCSRIKPFFS